MALVWSAFLPFWIGLADDRETIFTSIKDNQPEEPSSTNPQEEQGNKN